MLVQTVTSPYLLKQTTNKEKERYPNHQKELSQNPKYPKVTKMNFFFFLIIKNLCFQTKTHFKQRPIKMIPIVKNRKA
uniref:Putative ovule protein n=1 Tax=Solanum chacoense TaxID=4108 RepID=A0A0V0GIM7_SOLCH